MARTDWRYDDIVTENDMNEIGKEINSNTENIQKLSEEISRPDYSAPQTTVSSVISLDNTLDGKLKYTLKGRTYTNIVENGDFKDGFSGWIGSTAVISVSNNTLTVTGNGIGRYPSSYSPIKAAPIEGKRYFVRGSIRVTNAECELMWISLADDIGNISPYIVTPVPNTWNKLYKIITIPSSRSGDLRFVAQHQYPDAATANGKTMEVQEVMALDLDQYPDLQGLTAEEINAQIPNYIDGMQSVENVKMVSVGKNLCSIEELKDYIYRYDPNATYLNEDGKNIIEFKEYLFHLKPFMEGNFKPNTRYTFTMITKKIGGGVFYFVIRYTDGTTKITSNTVTSEYTTRYITSDTGKSIHYVHFSYNVSGYATWISLDDFQIKQSTTPTPYEPYKESTMYLPIPLRQLPNGVSDTLDNEGNYVRRTEKYILKSVDIEGLNTISYTNVDIINIYLSPLSKIKNYGTADSIATKIATDKTTPRNGGAVDTIEGQWKHSINPTLLQFIIPKGIYANLTEAQTALAGTRVIYELAEPITQKLNIPPVTSFKDGTLMFENKRKYILQADDITEMATSGVNVDRALISQYVFEDLYPFRGASYLNNADFSINGRIASYSYDFVSEIGKYFTYFLNNIMRLAFIVPKGTTLAQAKEQLAGLEIEYETVPFPLPEVEYSYPVNLAASVQGNTEMVAQLSREIGDLWFTLLPLADKELAMGLVVPLTTETTADLKSKINQILDIWT